MVGCESLSRPRFVQAPNMTPASTFNMLTVTSAAMTPGVPMFAVRGDGLVSATMDAQIGSGTDMTLTINSIIQGATPFTFEGGYVWLRGISP